MVNYPSSKHMFVVLSPLITDAIYPTMILRFCDSSVFSHVNRSHMYKQDGFRESVHSMCCKTL